MTKSFVMVKDNARINADAKLAAELRLRGYKEENEAAAVKEPASQPNPYTEEDMQIVKKQLEIVQAENEALKAANVEKLETEKVKETTAPAAQPQDKAVEHDAPKKGSAKK